MIECRYAELCAETRSSAVAERPCDASYMSVVSFNSTTLNSSLFEKHNRKLIRMKKTTGCQRGVNLSVLATYDCN